MRIWIEDPLNMCSHFQIYEKSNTCVSFISSLPEDQSSDYLILIDVLYEYFPEMIIDLPQTAHIYLYYQNKDEIWPLDNKHIRFSTNKRKELCNWIVRNIDLMEDIPPTISIFTSSTTNIRSSCLFWSSIRNVCLVSITSRCYSSTATSD